MYLSHSGLLDALGKCVSSVEVYHTKETEDLAIIDMFN